LRRALPYVGKVPGNKSKLDEKVRRFLEADAVALLGVIKKHQELEDLASS
jgi:hypothetical protein